jgi:hypothetical protein
VYFARNTEFFNSLLRTAQQHPHVHLVVKAEDEQGRRLHIDKEMLRHWREDFARAMKEQGIAANATPRYLRGQNKGNARDAMYRAGRRGISTAIRQRVNDVADTLDAQGEISLASEVRNFARTYHAY